MLVIGLTGNLGSGKTTVARMFEKLGAKVLDADQMAHRLISPGGRAFKQVIRVFGRDILRDGEIDRKKLASIVFEDHKKLETLNRLIHPKVIQDIRQEIAFYKRKKTVSLIVVDAPLLIESGLNALMDAALVVKATRALQLRRVMEKKGFQRNDALQRMKRQLPLREKLKYTDIVIDNRGTLQQTRKQVQEVWRRLLKTSK